MSATLDTATIQRYLGGCPVVKVPGQVKKLTITYEPRTVADYRDAAVQKCMLIIEDGRPRDILVFMTGMDDVRTVAEDLSRRTGRDRVVVRCLLGSSSNEEKDAAIRRYPGLRKIVVATEVAETSITIDGLVFVVDSLLVITRTPTTSAASKR